MANAGAAINMRADWSKRAPRVGDPGLKDFRVHVATVRDTVGRSAVERVGTLFITPFSMQNYSYHKASALEAI